ncbi:hypothetical protein Agabi119p4_10392 [Agaricus bisporus var. burnettii]|uniref:Uncharacterized protein n=1 Tax=Agaricus bisporus var. burnettii TaxID=192524 RepID=A0A8H7C2T2_AGABI|nr:hypothetical protein Agabi119p4_10392 [Agaricus bisporus var. burnettii]
MAVIPHVDKNVNILPSSFLFKPRVETSESNSMFHELFSRVEKNVIGNVGVFDLFTEVITHQVGRNPKFNPK